MTPIHATWMISNNIGDMLTPWLIEKIAGETPIYVPFETQFPKYMVTGSILNHAIDYTTVWGAGFANRDDCLKSPAVDIRAVRGPVTAQRVGFQAGIKVEVCGDPAILLPRFIDCGHEKHGTVGLCPHYLHQREFVRWARGSEQIRILNVFDSPENFVVNLLSCDVVYSSSLHGLVLADAYGIPNQWIEGTATLGGDRSKFQDHIQNVYVDRQSFNCLHLYQLPRDVGKLRAAIIDNKPPAGRIKEIQDALWDTCPFRPDIKETEPMTIELQSEAQKPLLSILILTIPTRAPKLEKLMAVLRPQIPEDASVEIIVHEEAAIVDGGPSIGANRNAAIAESQGRYVCFIDDDDLVTEDYVDWILSALEEEPDVVGIKGHYIAGQNEPQEFIHSIQYTEWFTKGGVHYRCPNHLNPVKRELALQVPYEEINHGEDQKYSMALRPLLKTEKMIDKVIYKYLK